MPRLKNAETIILEYKDNDQIKTERTVDLIEIRSENGRTYLETFCHARGAPRTFRSDQIDAIVYENGEVFSPPQFLHALTSDPERIHTSSFQTTEPESTLVIDVKVRRQRKWTIGGIVKTVAALFALAVGFSMELKQPGSVEERLITLVAAWTVIYIPIWLIVWVSKHAIRMFK